MVQNRDCKKAMAAFEKCGSCFFLAVVGVVVVVDACKSCQLLRCNNAENAATTERENMIERVNTHTHGITTLETHRVRHQMIYECIFRGMLTIPLLHINFLDDIVCILII